MTDFRDKPDATDRWRATIKALEAEEVRRLVMLRTARRRRNTSHTVWHE
jgi:hypothetical protein